MALTNALLMADVMHARLSPKKHSLKYKVFYLSFELADVKSLASRFLSLSRWNLFGYYEKDHGFGGLRNEEWIRSVLKDFNVTAADGKIVLVTMPRVIGYGFNPVSFWFCLDKEGRLRAALSEVNNTFNERHCYLCFHEDQRPIERDDWMKSGKVFHVSPFLKVRGFYNFRFAYGEEKIGVFIDYHEDNGEKVLITALTGKRIALTDRNLINCFFICPLLTLKVIGLIHYHALRLVMKGITYNNKPTPPVKDITR